MSQFSQQQMDFFGETPIGQVPDMPSQISNGEDSSPLHNNESDPALSSSSSTRQQTNKREHTSHKLSLSVMHKILYWEKDSCTKKFLQLLSQINKNQNNSTAVKFIMLADKAGLLPVLKSSFDNQATQRLIEVSQKRSWSSRRFTLAIDFKIRIVNALNCRSMNERIDIIWAGHNHRGKKSKSHTSVTDFRKKIRKITKNQLRKRV